MGLAGLVVGAVVLFDAGFAHPLLMLLPYGGCLDRKTAAAPGEVELEID